MEKQPMDAKRLKLLKAAIVKLREVKNLMNKINIDAAANFDCRVIGITYDRNPVNGEPKIRIHLDSLTTLQQLCKGIKAGKPTEHFNQFNHRSGDVMLFCLVDKEGK